MRVLNLSQKVYEIDARCIVCRKPLQINNESGYCKRHSERAKKAKYHANSKFRETVLKRNAAWHEAHKEELAAKAKERYAKRKQAIATGLIPPAPPQPC